MKMTILNIFAFLFIHFFGFSQSANMPNPDSSLFNSPIIDSTLNIKDSIQSVRITEDTIDISLSLKKDTVLRYKNSIEFSTQYLKKIILLDSNKKMNDTLKKAINNLINYIEYKQIDSTINFLQQYIITDSNLFIIDQNPAKMDTFEILRKDSVVNAIQLLIKYALEDSTEIYLTNRKNDSLRIILKQDSDNLYRFRLFDDDSEVAGIRVYAKNKKDIKIFFEPGVVLNKIEKKQIIEPSIPINLSNNTPLIPTNEILTIGIWDLYGVGTMNFSQGYVSNWVKGGQSSIATLTVLKFNANYTKMDTRWDNDIEIKLGAIGYTDKDQEITQWFRKNEDNIIINSKYGQKAFKEFYYTFLTTIQTQFLKGYDYPKIDTAVSKFLSPGYLILSLGLDYKPSKDFTLMLSPLTTKFTLVADTANILNYKKFGLEQGKKLKTEVGGYIISTWKANITENIQLENKFNFFMNYSDMFKKDSEKPRKPDVDWEFSLNFKISKFIVSTINTHLIYDNDILFPVLDGDGNEIGKTDKIQFKEYFNIGFSYRF